jgi:hypothetical protein
MQNFQNNNLSIDGSKKHTGKFSKNTSKKFNLPGSLPVFCAGCL